MAEELTTRKRGRRGQEWYVRKGIHNNFSSIFPRFRDIAAFVLQHTTFPHSTSSLPKFFHVPLGVVIIIIIIIIIIIVLL